jgi:hypothetical protein
LSELLPDVVAVTRGFGRVWKVRMDGELAATSRRTGGALP